MISYAEAARRILAAARRARPLPLEEVPLSKALGRVAARRVLSPEPWPAFDNSAMDGFALRARDVSQAAPSRPVRLEVRGRLAAGDWPRIPCPAGSAVEIMTGAPLPRNCDSVVRVEDVILAEGGRAVELREPARAGDYIRRAGYDLRRGSTLLEAGTLIDLRHLLALAALGRARVAARRKPRVALISTGRELVPPSRRAGAGQVRNATETFLLSALAASGAEARSYGTVPDDPDDFKGRLGRALKDSPDAVVTTGAVSKGCCDFVPGVLQELGADILYHGVAIRPGKPALLAHLRQGPLLFGMPGNPISTVVGLRFFLLPYLSRLQGRAPERPLRARLEADSAKPEGLLCFMRASLSAGPSGISARVLPGQASFQLASLLAAQAWAVLPERGTLVRAGSVVDCWPLWPRETQAPLA